MSDYKTKLPTSLSTWGVLKLFLNSRGSDPEFAKELARRALDQRPDEIDGLLVLDLGCGPGYYSEVMQDLGACVISVEINEAEFKNTERWIKNPVVGDGRQLPFESESFDAILCSNVLEHTPESEVLLSELTRCLKTNGWAYVSWTNWLSPWGGHAVAPLHYLGPKRSLAVWTRLFGKPKGKNIPLAGVWPYSIKQIIREIRNKPNVEILRIFPRYWPRLKVIARIPLVREFLTWNCVITLRKIES